MDTPKVIKIAKAHETKSDGEDVLRSLASLCYYYPAYTLRMARNVPYKHVKIMLSQAKRMEAIRFHNQAQIAAAPHTKKGQGVKKLLKHFERVAKNG
jgi:hypothetical protein